MITLFKYDNYEFTLLNLILFSCFLFLWILLRRWSNKKFSRFLNSSDWLVPEKEKKLRKLIRQILFVIFFILGVKSLTYGNPDYSFAKILDLEIFGFASGENQDGTTSRFTFTIGRLIFLLIIIFVSKIIVSAIRITIHRTTKSKDWIDEGRRYTIIQLSKYFIYTIAFIIAIQELGMNITFLIAGSAALFVGIGLGLQSVLADVFSGIILLFDGSVKVGDIIEFPDEEISKVQNIYIRTSKVKTLDGKYIIVPNSKLTKDNVINLTSTDKATRFHIKVSVAYGSDTKLVKELLYKCALEHSLVEKRKNIIITFDDFGDFALKFRVYFWVRQTWEIFNIKSDIRFMIDQRFREHGVKIPFPQHDLHIISDHREGDQQNIKPPYEDPKH